jgi:hypothetical protein
MTRITEWRGEISDHADALESLVVADSYVGRNGAEYALPARDAYEEAMRFGGVLGPDVDLCDEPTLAAVAQAHWHAAGPNACEFARYMSAVRAEHGWMTVIMSDLTEPRSIADEISTQVSPRVEDPDVEVVSILLPQLDDERILAKVIARLGWMADWELREEGIDEDAARGPVVRLGLRLAVEFDHWSEVLAGEFAIRAKAPERRRRDQRAFMAHIPVDLDKPEFGEWWDRTRADRHRRLPAEQDLRGKAKVTFAISRGAWEEASA